MNKLDNNLAEIIWENAYINNGPLNISAYAADDNGLAVL